MACPNLCILKLGKREIQHVVCSAGLVPLGEIPCAYMRVISVYVREAEGVERGKGRFTFISSEASSRHTQTNDRCDLGIEQGWADDFSSNRRPHLPDRLYTRVALVRQDEVEDKAGIYADTRRRWLIRLRRDEAGAPDVIAPDPVTYLAGRSQERPRE